MLNINKKKLYSNHMIELYNYDKIIKKIYD